jgi:hypothetical protein
MVEILQTGEDSLVNFNSVPPRRDLSPIRGKLPRDLITQGGRARMTLFNALRWVQDLIGLRSRFATRCIHHGKKGPTA